jgi:hypothetical protein
MKNNEMGRACSSVGNSEVHTVFRWGKLREGDYLKDPGTDGRIILQWIFEKWDGGMDRDRRRALLNTVINYSYITCGECPD